MNQLNSTELNQHFERTNTPPNRIIIGQCRVVLFSNAWDAKRTALRITCTEIASRKLLVHPQIKPSLPFIVAGLSQAIKKSPVLFFTNPIGRSVFLDLESLYDGMRNYTGLTPYYQKGSDDPIMLPPAEIPEPQCYRFTSDGKVAFCESTRTSASPALSRKQKRKLWEIFAILKRGLRLKDYNELKTILQGSQNPVGEFECFSRIARVYEQYTKGKHLSEAEQIEIIFLLTNAPSYNAEDYLESYSPSYVSKEVALEVMKLYHTADGPYIPAFYEVSARL